MPEVECCKCGGKIQYELIELMGTTFNFKPSFCEACIVAQEKLDEEEAEKQRMALALAQLPLRYDPKRGNRKAVEMIGTHAFVGGKPSGKSLWIGGKTGAGKTTGCCAVLEIWAKRGNTFKWRKCNDIMNGYSSLLGENCTHAAAYLKDLAYTRSLLIIDDLGVGSITQRGEELLFEIIDTRMVRGRVTWITSNLKPEGLSGWIKDSLMAERIIRRVKDTFEELSITRSK
jgi:DNA replication protein DnaC